MPSSKEGLEFLKDYTLKEIEWYYYDRMHTTRKLQELSCPNVIIEIRLHHALSVRDYVHNGGEFHVGEPKGEIFSSIEEQEQYPDEYELRRRKLLDPELDFYYRNNDG